ncbi:MAG: hypothetical protein AVDCRST_MAG10-71 [uncultured Acidimicrobiales bacterium]|uniref:Uncharacterized protein n=1 Tax=uncultured Acidimicrobiales bacterium TaxID=310071 RepID=A0A6J4GZI6_9ACTN|nr:MAG: hypothetical protein AVDCRST_MAG10-71 [uncultured Acidimicrobiales bacterium]
MSARRLGFSELLGCLGHEVTLPPPRSPRESVKLFSIRERLLLRRKR